MSLANKRPFSTSSLNLPLCLELFSPSLLVVLKFAFGIRPSISATGHEVVSLGEVTNTSVVLHEMYCTNSKGREKNEDRPYQAPAVDADP